MLPGPASRDARPTRGGSRDDPPRRRRSAGARRPSRRGDEPGEGLGYFVEMVRGRLAGGGAGAPARIRRARVDGRQELPRDHRRMARALPLRTGAIRGGGRLRRHLREVGREELDRGTGRWRGARGDAARTQAATSSGRGAGEGGGRSRASDRPGRHADGRAHGSRRGADGERPRAPTLYRSSRTRCGGTRRRKSFPQPLARGRCSRSSHPPPPRRRSSNEPARPEDAPPHESAWRGHSGKAWRSVRSPRMFGRRRIRLNDPFFLNPVERCERCRRIDKLGVNCSSPAPPI